MFAFLTRRTASRFVAAVRWLRGRLGRPLRFRWRLAFGNLRELGRRRSIISRAPLEPSRRLGAHSDIPSPSQKILLQKGFIGPRARAAPLFSGIIPF